MLDVSIKSDDDELKLDDRNSWLESLRRAILFRICGFLTLNELCTFSKVSKLLREASSSIELWKERSIARWPELAHAKEVSDNEWKSLYGRKHKEGTNIQDFAKIYQGCDFYQCPNGHAFLIGECRLPMQIGRCPECKEKIGGKHHAMLNTNQRRGNVMRNVLGEENASLDNLHSILKKKPVSKAPSHMRVIKYTRPQRRNVWLDRVEEETDPEPPAWLTCPLTLELYNDPVATPNGQVFEREKIEEYVRKNSKCPTTGKSLGLGDLEPVPETKRACERWRRKHRGPGHRKRSENLSRDSIELIEEKS